MALTGWVLMLGAMGEPVTLSRAAVLVMVPAALVAVTVKSAPSSAGEVLKTHSVGVLLLATGCPLRLQR